MSSAPAKAIAKTLVSSRHYSRPVAGIGANSAYRPQDLNFSHSVFVRSTANNTHVVLVDASSNRVVTKCSAGMCGLKKAARSTSDAGFQATVNLTQKAKQMGVYPTGVHLVLKGFGAGRDQALRALTNVGWKLTRLSDATPILIGGCRPPKKRRV